MVHFGIFHNDDDVDDAVVLFERGSRGASVKGEGFKKAAIVDSRVRMAEKRGETEAQYMDRKGRNCAMQIRPRNPAGNLRKIPYAIMTPHDSMYNN